MKRYALLVATIALLGSHMLHAKLSGSTDALTITMLDIGQGDAIHIRTPEGRDILIDGGPDERLLAELGDTMPHTDTNLELVIATHPDADHIGGFPALEKRWTVGTLLVSGAQNDNPLHDAYLEWERAAIDRRLAHAGDRIEVESDLSLTILNPGSERVSDVNEQSVVVLLRYKEFTALLTGDAGIPVEKQLIKEGLLSDVDLLKVSHHGSKSGTSMELLDVIRPEVALISVGAGNSFGHPHAQVIHRLYTHEVSVFRVDLHGRVTCTSTGGAPTCTGARM